MAWGIFMTFMTLFGMMVLAIRTASSADSSARTWSDYVAPEPTAHEQSDLRKAA